MKRTELVRHTPLRSGKPLERSNGKIRPVSAKRAREVRAYTVLRRDWLAEHPRCGFPGGCAWPATEIHHRRGRVGALFLDTKHWTQLCHEHHAYLTLHPSVAYEMGMSERRVGGAA